MGALISVGVMIAIVFLMMWCARQRPDLPLWKVFLGYGFIPRDLDRRRR